MTTNKKPATGAIREAGCDADRRNHGSFRSILQTVIVRLVVCGLLPITVADWILRRKGLRHDTN